VSLPSPDRRRSAVVQGASEEKIRGLTLEGIEAFGEARSAMRRVFVGASALDQQAFSLRGVSDSALLDVKGIEYQAQHLEHEIQDCETYE
jgi:hypothetical protein